MVGRQNCYAFKTRPNWAKKVRELIMIPLFKFEHGDRYIEMELIGEVGSWYVRWALY